MEFFAQFNAIICQISDQIIQDQLYNIYTKICICGQKISSATKFIDFFVHDILDYTILNKDDKNFTKNITVFNIQSAINEITDSLSDKVKMKGINIEIKFSGFEQNNFMVKSD